MQRISPRRRHAILLCGAMALAAPLHAQSVRTGVDLSTSAEAVSNPYLDSASDEFVGAGTFEVRPWLVRETPTDFVRLEAFARLRAFTSEFDLEDSYGGSVQATSRLDTRTTAYGTLNLQSTTARSRLGSFDRLPGVTDPIIPENPIPEFPIGDDLNLIGLDGRTTQLNVQAGLDRTLDQRASVGGFVGYQRVSSEAASGVDYDNASIGLNYAYTVSEFTSLGLGASASRARYDGDAPDSTTLEANASVNHQAGEFWFLAATAGLATTRNDASRFGPADASLYVVGSLSACRRQPDQSFCLTARRAQQPSVVGGTQVQTSLGLNLNQRLSARDRIDASATYVRSSGEQFPLGINRRTEFVDLRTTFTRSFSDRLDGYAFVSGSRLYEDSPLAAALTERPSLAFGIGLRLRLGSLQ